MTGRQPLRAVSRPLNYGGQLWDRTTPIKIDFTDRLLEPLALATQLTYNETLFGNRTPL